ncbi:DUF1275 domain-containing protein [Streptomyces pluripotens]|uniref:DUF1275 domain-containing protein n=1 Tax=Streptomyces pluripotens TaxID=1355015 RepID=A0A221NWI8_9ACTN|nr:MULTISPECIES: YoaK family protein [Streptomyces]ARP70013.1 DUF1275 family protein [Streptomyces pluripotens]ASN24272.1 DUF1275 domain-containing protein [Streptomyces pluripotens]KIE25301.1 membrane protein [Streptomyces sp. MUSC 125]MCH0559963.1 DUF1275 domain-containing protein [Streptomyces sp. MUM 16J]
MTTPTTPVPPARDSEERGVRLVPVLLILTVVSGLVDAVSYLGLGHVFTANMTGNVVILGLASAGAPGFSIRHAATSLACFLPGAVVGGRLSARLRGGSHRTWARLSLAAEAVLIGAASAVAFAWPHAGAAQYALIALMAFAMGLRNATVRQLGVADVTTTVLTTTLTHLAAESRLGGGTDRRFPRRAGAVVAMFAGACLGAWLVLHHGLGIPLVIAALAAGALAVAASGRE